MLFDELQREAERRASSPEGMAMLFRALIKEFEEAIKLPDYEFHPETRLYYLLRQYVKFKRLYDYFKKDRRHGRSTAISQQKDTYYLEAIASFKKQLDDAFARIPPDRLAALKKEIGAKMSFGSHFGFRATEFCHTNGLSTGGRDYAP